MKKKEIWMSSKKHHEQLSEIFTETSGIKKLFGAFKIPEEFPYLKIRWQKLPVVFDKKAAMEITSDKIIFSPYAQKDINQYFNVDKDFSREIMLKNITRVSTYINPKPFMKTFNIEWIEISFLESGQEQNLLMCVGGKIIRTVKRETQELLELLKKAIK